MDMEKTFDKNLISVPDKNSQQTINKFLNLTKTCIIKRKKRRKQSESAD